MEKISLYMWYALVGVICFLIGFILAERKDLLSMFRTGSDVRDKKVAMFMVLFIDMITFATERIVVAIGYAKGLEKGTELPPVSSGWYWLIGISAFCFLAPDAAIKIGTKFAERKIDKVADNG